MSFNNTHKPATLQLASRCQIQLDAQTATEVPTTHFTPSNAKYPDGNCARPNQLNQVCDRGSRFQMLQTDNPNAYVAAHCRKHGLGAGRYGVTN